MRILISNDDGYLAPGLTALHRAIDTVAQTLVVAPDRNRSGASNSLTLTRPLRVNKGPNGFLYLDGTPTDCVHVALTGLMDDEPDMVVAGINHGANLGDDVIYSGTVATHFGTAGQVVLQVLERIARNPLPADSIINVNVPDRELSEIRGFKATRLGYRHKSEPVVRSQDPHGEDIYWVGPAGAEQDAGPGTDFWAVREGFVSVTPLQVDLTRHEQLQHFQEWLDHP